MKEQLDLVKILKDCPKGMELDCTMYDNVTLKSVSLDINNGYPICIETKHGFNTKLTKYGQNICINDAKCVIFPKGKTTWEGFHRPFKNGDILYIDCNDNDEDYEEYQYIFILKEINGNGIHCYCYIDNADGRERFETCLLATTRYTPRFASLIEKEKLFDAIKSRGYKWNDTTKTLEKLIEPKFFDPKLLQPFDKVLVRQSDERWHIQFFETMYEYDKNHPFRCLGGKLYSFCIPYAGNEYLLDTTDEPSEFYKY